MLAYARSPNASPAPRAQATGLATFWSTSKLAFALVCLASVQPQGSHAMHPWDFGRALNQLATTSSQQP